MPVYAPFLFRYLLLDICSWPPHISINPHLSPGVTWSCCLSLMSLLGTWIIFWTVSDSIEVGNPKCFLHLLESRLLRLQNVVGRCFVRICFPKRAPSLRRTFDIQQQNGRSPYWSLTGKILPAVMKILVLRILPRSWLVLLVLLYETSLDSGEWLPTQDEFVGILALLYLSSFVNVFYCFVFSLFFL